MVTKTSILYVTSNYKQSIILTQDCYPKYSLALSLFRLTQTLFEKITNQLTKWRYESVTSTNSIAKQKMIYLSFECIIQSRGGKMGWPTTNPSKMGRVGPFRISEKGQKCQPTPFLVGVTGWWIGPSKPKSICRWMRVGRLAC